MRKLIVLSFISHDGVMQAPGEPEEDPTGGFEHGGWVFGYFDDFSSQSDGQANEYIYSPCLSLILPLYKFELRRGAEY